MTAPVRSNNMKQCVCSYEQQNVWPHGINPLKTQLKLFYLKTQFVPRSKHFSISVVKKPISLCYIRQKSLLVVR